MDNVIRNSDTYDWQNRAANLWRNDTVPFDVTFTVRPNGHAEDIKAHRDVLSRSSQTFQAMLDGPVGARSRIHNERIEVQDLDPEAFRFMLRFIYTGNIDRHEDVVSEPFVSGVEVAFKTMKCAEKYGILGLQVYCRDWILDDVHQTFKTANSIAQHGFLYALFAHRPEWIDTKITEAVWREVDVFTETVLRVPDEILRTADEAFMIKYLSRDFLTVSIEMKLYHFAVRWARLVHGSSEPLERSLGNVAKTIRFRLMDADELISGPLTDVFHLRDQIDNAPRAPRPSSSIIGIQIFEVDEAESDTFKRGASKGHLKIQTTFDDNPRLAELVKICFRQHAKRNKMSQPLDMWICFQHKKNLHRYMSAFREKERIHLSNAELKLISTGGLPASKIALGSRDVAVPELENRLRQPNGFLLEVPNR